MKKESKSVSLERPPVTAVRQLATSSRGRDGCWLVFTVGQYSLALTRSKSWTPAPVFLPRAKDFDREVEKAFLSISYHWAEAKALPVYARDCRGREGKVWTLQFELPSPPVTLEEKPETKPQTFGLFDIPKFSGSTEIDEKPYLFNSSKEALSHGGEILDILADHRLDWLNLGMSEKQIPAIG